jgi:hypothetical protein
MRVAGQECPAYRVLEIAAFISAPGAGHSAAFSMKKKAAHQGRPFLESFD